MTYPLKISSNENYSAKEIGIKYEGNVSTVNLASTTPGVTGTLNMSANVIENREGKIAALRLLADAPGFTMPAVGPAVITVGGIDSRLGDFLPNDHLMLGSVGAVPEILVVSFRGAGLGGNYLIEISRVDGSIFTALSIVDFFPNTLTLSEK